MRKCANCGNDIPDDSSFCVSCGTPASNEQPSAASQQQPPVANQQPSTKRCPACGSVFSADARICGMCGNSLDGGQQPLFGQSYVPIKKGASVKFIFVTALIFMILTALRILGSMLDMSTWAEHGNRIKEVINKDSASKVIELLTSIASLRAVACVLAFGAILTLMVFASSAKKVIDQDGIAAAAKKKLFIAAILAVSLCVVYCIVELLYAINLSALAKEVSDVSTVVEDDKTLFNEMAASGMGSVVALVVIAVFMAIDVFMARSLKVSNNL